MKTISWFSLSFVGLFIFCFQVLNASSVDNASVAPSQASSFPQENQIGPNEVGQVFWGFKFVPPDGWISQMTEDGILLGHNTIAGMIFVFPHQASNMQEMKQQMQQGLQEEGTYLMPSGEIVKVNSNTFSCDLSGVVDGTTAKSKGFGVLSPYGGGAYILAISTPEMIGSELIAAAKQIALQMKFIKNDTPAMANFFVGKWTTYTKNTSNEMYFYPNGIYSENYEASYSGNFEDGGGANTGNWGTANQSNNQGHWTVKGTKEQGQIQIQMNNGNQLIYNYEVHRENGETYYNEYWIDGSLYSKSAL